MAPASVSACVTQVLSRGAESSLIRGPGKKHDRGKMSTNAAHMAYGSGDTRDEKKTKKIRQHFYSRACTLRCTQIEDN